MKHTTLLQAHHIRKLDKAGVSQRQIAAAVGVSQKTVSNILAGRGLLQQRQLADRMEALLGGVIVGNGNVRFHAASPAGDNDEGHAPTSAQHTYDTTYEANKPVPSDCDILSRLLAEETLLQQLSEAGIDASEVLVLDHAADTDEHAQLGGERAERDVSVHDETWDEFMARAKADGLSPGAINKRLENEGQDVDVWKVRDLSFAGWGSPWLHPSHHLHPGVPS